MRSSTRHFLRWFVALGALAGLTSQATAQSVELTPSCGIAGVTQVCLTGADWPEPDPVCHYEFDFDAVTVAPDQPDGLLGPPLTSFIVPGGAPVGVSSVQVELRLDSDGSLIVPPAAKPFKVVAAAAMATIGTSIEGAIAGSGEAVKITYTPDCAKTCDKIIFIQTLRRFKVDSGRESLTSITDWQRAGANCFSNAVERAGVETNPGGRRVDMTWGLQSPYYNQNAAGNLPAAGATANYGQVGNGGLAPVTAELFDRPTTGGACFPVGATKAILRFEAAPFCVAGSDKGKFLGHVVTWEHHQLKGMAGTIENVATSAGQPSADHLAALALWVEAKYKGKLPQEMPDPCM